MAICRSPRCAGSTPRLPGWPSPTAYEWENRLGPAKQASHLDEELGRHCPLCQANLDDLRDCFAGCEDRVMTRIAASSERTRKAMQRQRTSDTLPEIRLRHALHRLGLRYRLHQRPLRELRRNVDIVFRPSRVAVEVRGCFWHACETHATWPKANGRWWAEKLEGNRFRDRQLAEALQAAGWELIVVWEHDDSEAAAIRIAERVAQRRGSRRQVGPSSPASDPAPRPAGCLPVLVEGVVDVRH
jgi:DNA mismatch endonuclease (patch repair protein)